MDLHESIIVAKLARFGLVLYFYCFYGELERAVFRKGKQTV